MRSFKHTRLLLTCLAIYFCVLIPWTLAQSVNSLTKNQKSKFIGKEKYFSKSYGQIQFNKYRGQLPPKGTMIECALNCLSFTTCHCIGVNIHTSECRFYGLDESPPYNDWKSATSNSGFNSFSEKESNWTNRDYIFFTRDIFLDDSYEKVDISLGRKVLTSWTLDQHFLDLKKTKSKGKDSPKSLKKNKSIVEKGFPLPWVQIEFKESVYVTEIVLKTTKEKSSLLKHFQIRVGNESIFKFYENENGLEQFEGIISNWSSVKPFEKNNICFEQKTDFFASGNTKVPEGVRKSVKCQPCGLVGRFVTIQSMEFCSTCKNVQTNNTINLNQKLKSSNNKKDSGTPAFPVNQYPIPVVSIQVNGYVIGGKKSD